MNAQAQPESKFLTVNGLRLHYLDWGNPDAPPLMCVHGLRSNAHAFDDFARRFQDRYHIIAMDVRGRGDSAWSSEGAYTFTDYVADLESFVSQLGLERYTLLGTSMGGRIAMIYAASHANRLERLVINDIGPDDEAGMQRIRREATGTPESFASLDEVLALMVQQFPGLASRSETERRERAQTSYRQTADGRWVSKLDPAILQQYAARRLELPISLWPVLERMPCPTLILWGTASDILSEQQARHMVSALPKGELVPVWGVGHAPTLTEPAAVAALERFLGSPE